MIHINLLPVRQIRQRLQVRNEVAIYLACILLLAIAVSLVGLNKISRINDLKGENIVLSKKKASYQPILNEIDKLKKDKKEQQTKLDVIKKLKAGSEITVHVLDQIAKITPSNRLWLNSLTQSGLRVSISGIALDNATIAQYMNNITSSPHFEGAELSKSSQTVVAGAKLKSFGMSIRIAPPHTSSKNSRRGKIDVSPA